MSFLNSCLSETMNSKQHMLYLQSIIAELNKKEIAGAIVECGVWKGGCCMWMMHVTKAQGRPDRPFYLFDTFEGMTIPINHEKEDPRAPELFAKIEKGEYKRKYDEWHNEHKWAYAPIEYVARNIDKVNYDRSLIHFVQGDVCQTLLNSSNIPDEIAVLRLDTDWYDSTKVELDMLYPKLTVGGYLIVDDYFAWRGSRNATDEFLKDHQHELVQIDLKLTGNIFVMRRIQ